MKKLAIVLAVALVVFSALAYGKESALVKAAADQAAAEALLGPRAGGIVINAPAAQATETTDPAAAPQGQVAIPASSSATSGAGCP